MLNSDATIRAAQSSRALSLPEQLDAPSPGREALLEGFRQRNALLDYLFYDIGCVTPDEARRVAPHWAAEGAILLVPQTGAGDLKLAPRSRVSLRLAARMSRPWRSPASAVPRWALPPSPATSLMRSAARWRRWCRAMGSPTLPPKRSAASSGSARSTSSGIPSSSSMISPNLRSSSRMSMVAISQAQPGHAGRVVVALRRTAVLRSALWAFEGEPRHLGSTL